MSSVFWVAVVIGAITFLAPEFYSMKFQRSRESELVKLSREYEGVNKLNLKFALAWLLFSLLLPSFLFIISHKSSQFELIASAMMVLIFSGVSLFRGIFAMMKGVFPSTKYYGSRTLYAYGDSEEIKRFGRLVMIVSSGLGALAIISIVVILLM